MTEKELIVYNGKIIDKDDFSISLANRSFRYGDGVFETIRIMNGKPVFLAEHIDRLSLALFTFECENRKKLLESIKTNIPKLLYSNGLLTGGKLNIITYRNDGGLFRPYDNNFSYIITTSILLENNYEYVETRNVIGVYEAIKKQINILSSFKSNSSSLYVLAANWARRNHFDDAVIMNERGEIIEATSSNLFIYLDKTVITPPLDSGCVEGIMRRNVLQLLESQGIEVHEKPIYKEMLEDAEEVFITNVVNGIKIVTGYKTKRYFKDFSKGLIGHLSSQFDDKA